MLGSRRLAEGNHWLRSLAALNPQTDFRADLEGRPSLPVSYRGLLTRLAKKDRVKWRRVQ